MQIPLKTPRSLTIKSCSFLWLRTTDYIFTTTSRIWPFLFSCSLPNSRSLFLPLKPFLCLQMTMCLHHFQLIFCNRKTAQTDSNNTACQHSVRFSSVKSWASHLVGPFQSKVISLCPNTLSFNPSNISIYLHFLIKRLLILAWNEPRSTITFLQLTLKM